MPKKSKKPKNLFDSHIKILKILYPRKKWTILKTGRRAGIDNDAYANLQVNDLHRMGLVEFEKSGRSKFTQLTEKGKNITVLYLQIEKILAE